MPSAAASASNSRSTHLFFLLKKIVTITDYAVIICKITTQSDNSYILSQQSAICKDFLLFLLFLTVVNVLLRLLKSRNLNIMLLAVIPESCMYRLLS